MCVCVFFCLFVFYQVLKGELRETRYVVAPENENETENETESEGLDSSSSGEFADTNAGGGVSSSNEEGHRRPLAETSALTYASGGVTYIEDSMGFHKMANPSASEECVSLHLYSPGITDCNTWSDASSIRWVGPEVLSRSPWRLKLEIRAMRKQNNAPSRVSFSRGHTHTHTQSIIDPPLGGSTRVA